jgi:UDP-N-acetylmuramoylalanine--D-glutamate ligase
VSGPVLVLGLGVTGRAVLDALSSRGLEAFGVDDRPGWEARTCAERLSVELVESPLPEDWWALLERAGEVVVSPGVPDGHPVFAAAATAGVQVLDQ